MFILTALVVCICSKTNSVWGVNSPNPIYRRTEKSEELVCDIILLKVQVKNKETLHKHMVTEDK